MIDINDITIDPEFEACCPALSTEERTQLTANIIRDRGIRDPLVVWLNHGILVDGHNRLDIWRNACSADPDMAPEIIEKPFKDRAEVLSWIIRNQLGRRNLTDFQRVELALKLKPELQAKAKANQGARTDLRQNSDEGSKSMRVDDAIAKEAGTSRDTVRKVEAILDSGDAETAAAARSGEVSINQAAKRVKPVPSNVGALANAATPEEIAVEAAEPADLFRLKQAWLKTPKRLKKQFAAFVLDDLHPAAKPEGDEQGKGVAMANEAINVLQRIPVDDGLRDRAYEIVMDWIESISPQPAKAASASDVVGDVSKAREQAENLKAAWGGTDITVMALAFRQIAAELDPSRTDDDACGNPAGDLRARLLLLSPQEQSKFAEFAIQTAAAQPTHRGRKPKTGGAK